MKLVNESVTENTSIGTFVDVYPQNSSKTIPASTFGYLCNLDSDEFHGFSTRENVLIPPERIRMALVKFVKVKRPGLYSG
jgi:hypothetical protein